MKTVIFIAAAILYAGSLWGAASAEVPRYPVIGYLTVGNNVVVLPDLLRAGDRIVIEKMQGAVVFDKTIGQLSTSFSNLRIPSGVYLVAVLRRGVPLQATTVSFTRL